MNKGRLLKKSAFILLAFFTLSIGSGAFSTDSDKPPILETHIFSILGLSCPFCVVGIKKTFEKIDGVKSVDASLSEKTVTVQTELGICFFARKIKRNIWEGRFFVPWYTPTTKSL